MVALAYSREARFTAEPYLDVVPSSLPWLVKGALPTRGVAFLAAASKAGKSFFAIDLALRIASGAKVLGARTRQCGVVYIAAEDAPGCRARISAWRQQYRRESDTPFDFVGDSFNLLDSGDTDDLCDALEVSCERFDLMGHGLGLIIIDTLSRCIPGVDENNSQQMSAAFVMLQKIGLRFGCLILVLAHFGKAGEEKGIRGWSGMDANSDATLTIDRDKDDPDLRRITLAKVKNGRDGLTTAFRLKDVGLGLYDQDGDEISSCVVEFERAPDNTKAVRKKAMNVPEGLAFAAIKYITDHGRTQPIPTSVPGAKPWHKGISRSDISIQCMGTGFAYEGETQDATRMRLSRALQGLAATQRIRIEKDLIWLI